MKIVDILGTKFIVLDTFFSKFRGLMLRREVVPLLFVFKKEGIYPIHSLFVFQPFEAVYLDSNGKVVDVYNVKPFTLWVENTTPARYLLEVPVGWVGEHGITTGTHIFNVRKIQRNNPIE